MAVIGHVGVPAGHRHLSAPSTTPVRRDSASVATRSSTGSRAGVEPVGQQASAPGATLSTTPLTTAPSAIRDLVTNVVAGALDHPPLSTTTTSAVAPVTAAAVAPVADIVGGRRGVPVLPTAAATKTVDAGVVGVVSEASTAAQGLLDENHSS
jgi:hypothetical protein